jgi:putative spermidine/putrescine transport system permease protein
VVFVLGTLYFLLPLGATFLFSLKGTRGVLGFSAYLNVLVDPRFLRTFLFSLEMALLTIAGGLVLLLPTVVWVHLRLPRILPFLETVALLPFVVPPIVLVFGLIRTYSRPPFALVTSPALLVAAYIVISFPYLFRAIDSGVRALDLRTLVEASQSLGAGWVPTLVRVVVPSLRVSLLSAAFLTLSIVVGELTIAVILDWPAFGPYMALIGHNLAFEPAALAIMSFLLTWGSIAIIQAASHRRGGHTVTPGGVH